MYDAGRSWSRVRVVRKSSKLELDLVGSHKPFRTAYTNHLQNFDLNCYSTPNDSNFTETRPDADGGAASTITSEALILDDLPSMSARTSAFRIRKSINSY